MGNILARQNLEAGEEQATAEARDIFLKSGLDEASSFVPVELFVEAAMSGGFRGTESLFRLPHTQNVENLAGLRWVVRRRGVQPKLTTPPHFSAVTPSIPRRSSAPEQEPSSPSASNPGV